MASSYETYGWEPCDTITDHENFMDLVLLITRSSKLKQGSMACILVRPPAEILETEQQSCDDNDDDGNENASRKRTKLLTNNNLTDRIITIATNQSFYKENESDIHAEIVAISQVASSRLSTSITSTVHEYCSHDNGSTMTNVTPTTHNAIAYITMPPCKRCFAALVTAGITQIVSRYQSADIIQTIANQRNIQMIVIPENRIRIQNIIDNYHNQRTTERETTL